jgi:hypothetical protein
MEETPEGLARFAQQVGAFQLPRKQLTAQFGRDGITHLVGELVKRLNAIVFAPLSDISGQRRFL